MAVETLAGFGEVLKWTFTNNCEASLRQNGIQEYSRFYRLGSHQELLRRNEGNFEFVRMLVYVIKPRSGSLPLSSQGTYSVRILLVNVNSAVQY